MKKYFHILILFLGMGLFGFSLGYLMDVQAIQAGPYGLYFLAVLFISLYLGLLLTVVIHEAGHLILGLASGYRFVSFRIASWILIKNKQNHFDIKRYSLPGTLGQCLLDPPGHYGDSFPYKAYLLGGVLANGLTACLFLTLIIRGHLSGYPALVAYILAGINLFLGVTNAYPFKNSDTTTDGVILQQLRKAPELSKYLWAQLKINALFQSGQRLKEIPQDYFVANDDHPLASIIRVFDNNRLMDEGCYQEANAHRQALRQDPQLPAIYKSLLALDQVFFNLVQDQAQADLSLLEDPQVKQIKSAMKKLPSMLRLDYALALLKDQDPTQAANIKKQFDQALRHHPSQGEINLEQDLLALVDQVAEADKITYS
ncbi:M50 family metallopeptidase [Facklamia hominis]|uniref:M50 family metallopeptidase n=1 Tax=Facklamia hominis TaxID=178214 RepID=UPI00101CF610|nr:M50 family metallopeptidase [Facklamia hominis]RYC97553.1 M50 family peptidase [Facklamia hominis]